MGDDRTLTSLSRATVIVRSDRGKHYKGTENGVLRTSAVLLRSLVSIRRIAYVSADPAIRHFPHALVIGRKKAYPDCHFR